MLNSGVNVFFYGYVSMAIETAKRMNFPLENLSQLEPLFSERFIAEEGNFTKAVEYAIMEWKRRKFQEEFKEALDE